MTVCNLCCPLSQTCGMDRERYAKKDEVRLVNIEIITGRKPRSGNVKFNHRPKIRFSPRRGDSLHRFTSNLAQPTGNCDRLALQIFISIGTGVVMRPAKYQKFPLFGKESPRRGELLTDF